MGIQLAEVEHINLREVPKELEGHIKPELMIELFDVLDVDGSGDISCDEFVQGLMSLSLARHNQVPPEVVLMLKLVQSNRTKTQHVEQLVKRAIVDIANMPSCGAIITKT